MTPLSRTQRRRAAKHRRLVAFVIRKWFSEYRFDPVLWTAIWSNGWDGLLRATQKYDKQYRHSYGDGGTVRFSTYAVHYIWGYASKALEKHLRRPLALRLPIRQGDLRSPNNEIMPLADIFYDYREPSPDDVLNYSDLLAAAESSLRYFDPIDRYIIACHLGIDGQHQQVAAEIAIKLGISRARIGQRYRRAMVRFRKLCAAFQPK